MIVEIKEELSPIFKYDFSGVLEDLGMRISKFQHREMSKQVTSRRLLLLAVSLSVARRNSRRISAGRLESCLYVSVGFRGCFSGACG